MLERKEYTTTRINSIDQPTGFERALQFAEDTSFGRRLGPLESDALSKFATLNYRINEIDRDFDTLSSFKMNFSIPYNIGFDEKNHLMRRKIKKKEVPEFLKIHKNMAATIYSDFLNNSDEARLAAKEVLTFVKATVREGDSSVNAA